VKLVEYKKGRTLAIVYLDCEQKDYDLDGFLQTLKELRPKDYYQIIAQLDKTAENGICANKQKVKPLHGDDAKPLWEFCAKGGARVFWFRDRDRIVCTHGFIAGTNHDHKNDIKRGQDRRRAYFDHGGGKMDAIALPAASAQLNAPTPP
jgi:hypothetical protein